MQQRNLFMDEFRKDFLNDVKAHLRGLTQEEIKQVCREVLWEKEKEAKAKKPLIKVPPGSPIPKGQ